MGFSGYCYFLVIFVLMLFREFVIDVINLGIRWGNYWFGVVDGDWLVY